jgi:hypothetical protein
MKLGAFNEVKNFVLIFQRVYACRTSYMEFPFDLFIILNVYNFYRQRNNTLIN